MKVLLTIPHYFKEEENPKYGSNFPKDLRKGAVLSSLRSLFSLVNQSRLDVESTNEKYSLESPLDSQLDLTIVACIDKENHLLSELELSPQDSSKIFQLRVDLPDPKYLGYECHDVLVDNLGKYDLYCYLEDDLVIHDPIFFEKILWFTKIFGEDKVLQANRFEFAPEFSSGFTKFYIDPTAETWVDSPEVGWEETVLAFSMFDREYVFQHLSNRHAGSFFLTENQMGYMATRSFWKTRRDGKVWFRGPLESAATAPVCATFKCYKSVNPRGFLELEHWGQPFVTAVEKSKERMKNEKASIRS